LDNGVGLVPEEEGSYLGAGQQGPTDHEKVRRGHEGGPAIHQTHNATRWFPSRNHLLTVTGSMSPRINQRTRILLLALTLRVGLALSAWSLAQGSAEPFLAPDSDSYVDTATSLATTGTFTHAGKPDIVRTPGYPLLLVPGVWLGGTVGWGIALQCVLNLVTILLVYDLAYRLGGQPAATTAALLLTSEPLTVIYSVKLLSETCFATLLVASLWGLVRGYLDDDPRRWAFGAACLGASALVRPIGYGLVLVFTVLALVFFTYRRFRPLQARSILRASWLATTMGLMLVPSAAWQARNLAVADYRGLSAITDINLYFYQGAAVQARLQGRSFYEVQNELGYHDVGIFNDMRPDLAVLPQGPRLQRLGAEGAKTVAAHPLVYAGIHLRGVIRVLFDPGGVEVLRLLGAYPTTGGLLGRILDDGLLATGQHLVRERPELIVVEGIFGLFLLVLYVAAGRGALQLARTRPILALVLVAAVLILLVAAGGPMSLSRFRHPVMPVLCLLAGLGWWRSMLSADSFSQVPAARQE
jgi:4-amino-4-deoxy-L-arabinose transferase-like glycosyltransferase